jgi:uncharacterized protein (DUF1697 family)
VVDATGERVAFPLGVALAAAEMRMPALARAVPMAVGVVVVPTRPIELMPSTLCRKTILHQMVNNLRPLVRKYEAVNLYVALLRGINVGGSNLIRMTALKACFEAQGFGHVTTYIQSGNVLFTAGRASQHALTARIERTLSKTFAYESRVVVRSLEQMKSAVENAPTGFGREPFVYRYDVIFLKDPLTVAEALKSVSARPGVDRVFAGEGVVYFSRLISKAAQSHLSRVVATPAYQHMTIRNWNTTARLVELMIGIQGSSRVMVSRRSPGRG